MARNIVPSSVSFSCDCCTCDCGVAPALSLHGMRVSQGIPHSYALDFCEACLAKFEEWVAAQKSHE